MEELTQEQIEKNIYATYDSVNLIKKLNLKEVLTSEEEASKVRNVEHIGIMLTKEWFTANLSELQKSELEEIIS